jgi:hypothetical protein
MKSKLFWSVITIVLFCYSCKSDQKEIAVSSPLFDLSAYFSEQISLLEKSNSKLTKKLTKQGKTETALINDVDWKQELKPFTETDFNKPAVLISYKTNKVVNGNKSVIQYAAKDSISLIRELTIHLKNNIPDTIYIRKVISNSYVNSTEIMYYYGNGNYELQVNNIPRIGKEITFVLKGIAGYPVQQ